MCNINEENTLQAAGILQAKNLVNWKQKQGLLKVPSPISKVIISPQSAIIRKKQRFSSKLIKGLMGTHICINKAKGIYLSCGWGVGAPALVAVCEELHALGATEFYLAGVCGRLSVDIEEGAILIAGNAIREDGTSKHYIISDSGNIVNCPDKERVNSIANCLEANIATYVSTDAPYRETLEKYKSWRIQNASAIDMETAALYAFGAFYNIKAYSIGIAADLLTEEKWTMANNYSTVEKQLSSTIDNLIEIIKR